MQAQRPVRAVKKELIRLTLGLGLAALSEGDPTTTKSRSSEAIGARETLGTFKNLGAGFVEAAAAEADEKEVFTMLREKERKVFVACENSENNG